MAFIKVAYAISRKGGSTTYRARAYAFSNGLRSTFTVALDDTREAATSRAVDYVKQAFARDGLPVPIETVDAGRLSAPMLDNFKF